GRLDALDAGRAATVSGRRVRVFRSGAPDDWLGLAGLHSRRRVPPDDGHRRGVSGRPSRARGGRGARRQRAALLESEGGGVTEARKTRKAREHERHENDLFSCVSWAALAFVCFVGVCFGSLGCTKHSTNPDELTIAVIPKGTSHVFWQSIHAGAEKAAREV